MLCHIYIFVLFFDKVLLFFAGDQTRAPAVTGSVFVQPIVGEKAVSPMKATLEQSSEAPKSPVMPVTAEVVHPHEAETGTEKTVPSPVKTSEAVTSEAEKPKEPNLENAGEEEVEEEIHLEGPYDVPPSPPPQRSTLSPPRRQVRREESSSRSAPTGKGTVFGFLEFFI